MKTCFLVLTLLIGLNCTAAFAQLKVKYGKFDQSELDMKVYEKDTAANAVVLFDKGRSYIQYGSEGFQLYHKRHRRVKILNKQGYEHADFSVVLYDEGGNDEKITSLKGHTYVVKNGKVEKFKLEKKDVFKEHIRGNWYRHKFTMPNIEEGAIYEIEYSILSDFIFNLQEWYFQEDIPVLYSEYQTEIPEYFGYRPFPQGHFAFTDHQTSEKRGNINLGQGESLDYRVNQDLWVVKDAPALELEDFVTTYEDYVKKIEYQLIYTDYPNDSRKDVSATWPKVARQLMESENFGYQLGRTGFLKSEVKAICAQHSTPEEQIAAIVSFVQNNVKWDEINSLYSNGIKKALDEHKGNSADMNLMMIVMLREAGLKADPVILSTRQHGRVNQFFPKLDDFNYVLAYVRTGEQKFLIDATDPLLPVGMVPYKCMNGQGRIITEAHTDWINIDTGGMITEVVNVVMRVNEDGEFAGEMRAISGSYAARVMRSEILRTDEEKYMEENWNGDETGILIDEYKIEGVKKDLAQPVKNSIKFTLDGLTTEDDMLYLNPVLVKSFEENPFKQEEREYPVDFGSKILQSFKMTFTLPEGFDVEEIPESVAIALPNKAGSFSYRIFQQGGVLMVTNTVKINQTLFAPSDYAVLKEFFAQIIEKEAEQLVLKRRT
ncbi:transglutaminase domain-containing protein [Flammeovirgaceae bacterium SG7u.111]|nr:transglutaminase domain-containing protein [Flammeovirgaceae bacterium SG7u.132]WPO33006.1 transglutaminase domain-containing protein [Flammeovirgaceae bacterium SG7u.111]